MTSPATTPDSLPGGMRKSVLIASLMCTISIAALDATIVATAMPTIVGKLGGLSLFSWVFSVYLLASTVTVPLYGKLSDLYGRKPVLLFGCSVFLIGSGLCGAAQSMPMLVVFRGIQGLGAGAVLPVTMTIIGDSFSVEERAKVQGLFSSVWGVASLCGPAIGGLVVDGIGWRWAFYLNLPLGLVSMFMIARFFKEQRVHRQKHVIDYAGTVLLTSAVTALLLGLLESVKAYGWLGWQTLSLFGLAGFLLIPFAWVERRSPEPVLPLPLFRNRVILIAAAATFAGGGIMFGTDSYVPLFAQGVRGGSAIQAGLAVLPLSVMWPIGAVISGKIIMKKGFFVAALTGTCLLIVGTAGMQFVTREASLAVLLISMGIIGTGLGFMIPSLLIAVQNAVDWSNRGVATATIQFFRTIGGSIWVGIMGAILTSETASRLAGVQGVPAGDSADTLLNKATRASLPSNVLDAMENALAGALHDVYLMMFISACIAFGLVLLFPRGRVEDMVASKPPSAFATEDFGFESEPQAPVAGLPTAGS